ncbi:hypothetical protein J7481_24140 [Labrenzia sp. R4_2]|uniref:hypothetical protein n=1 Tax=Labrenzia sp. R4_2 TaxID=2821107 RepID=UPI001ADCDA46|nr:hypothetical protein [Labrenzia sp. R4_2]MBO9422619.1 hypothetical protein [Labrenzia sp. R4_2]
MSSSWAKLLATAIVTQFMRGEADGSLKGRTPPLQLRVSQTDHGGSSQEDGDEHAHPTD